MAQIPQSPATRSHTPDENDNLLPTPATSSQESTGKPKQLPTITPRRFKKFFTPRTSLQRHVKIGSSRQVLRDITAGGANGRTRDRLSSSSQGGVEILEDWDENARVISRKRKRTLPISPDMTPDNSSPLKRIRASTHEEDFDLHTDAESVDSDTQTLVEEIDWKYEPDPVEPIVRWKEGSRLGRRLGRECAADIGHPRKGVQAISGSGELPDYPVSAFHIP